MMKSLQTSRPCYLAAIVLALVLAGCAATSVRPTIEAVRGRNYEAVAVGKIDCPEKRWEYLVPQFRHAFIERLKDDGTFGKVVEAEQTTFPESYILLEGTITEVDKRNNALRWIVGFGAGSAHAKGMFEIQDHAGNVPAKLEQKDSYAGGEGIGGADFLDMEDLLKKLGTDTAETVIRRAKGESLKLEPPGTGESGSDE